jgi:hypothetical protein
MAVHAAIELRHAALGYKKMRAANRATISLNLALESAAEGA